MNGLDLFSGIGGITKALQGYVRPIAYCENDRYAQGVLLSRMWSGDLPWAPIAEDVRELRGTDFASAIDIIYGGFPCQDISLAGRGAGLDGKRSGLFFEIVRLVSELSPTFIFLENVPAITGRGLGTVTAEFAALRYDCRWGVLSAADVGANHLRDRWWLLAHAGSKQYEGKGDEVQRTKPKKFSKDLADTQSGTRQRPTPWKARHTSFSGEKMADADSSGGTAARGTWPGWTESSNSHWWAIEPDVGRVAHGVPFRVDRLKGLGNSVVPAQAREAFERLMGLK